MSSGVKLQLLQNAVHPVEELRQVKIQADQYKTQSGQAIGYDHYVSLLKSAADQYDSQFTPKSPPNFARSNKRSVYQAEHGNHSLDTPIHDLDYSNKESHSPEEEGTESHELYELYAAVQGVRLPWDKWKKLSQKDQAAWKTLSLETKRMLLGNLQANKLSTSQLNSKRKVNLHETDPEVLQSLMDTLYDQRLGSEGDVDNAALSQDEDQSDNNEDDTLLAHATNRHSDVPPSDLAKILSTSISKYKKGSGKWGEAKVKGKTKVNKAEQDQITVNGVPYTRQVNTHELKQWKSQEDEENQVYAVSTHKTSYSGYALVDRGANGGIAGANVKVIEKTHCHVNVEGIDNHQVTDIVIATVGGVIMTQRGPVIGIMHQFAYTGKGKMILSCVQMEHYQHDVNDKSMKTSGGLQ